MVQQDLNNDMVKLVEYTIVSVARGNEGALPDGSSQVVFTERMTSEAFAAWRIADYTANHPIEPDATKFLRVYYKVLESWPKEDLRYEEKRLVKEDKKLDVLEKIANKV